MVYIRRFPENLCTLLVGMETGAATAENIMEVPQKIKNRISMLSKIPTLGIFPKKTKTVAWKDKCNPMFIAALFTTTKVMEATTVSLYR